MTRRLFLKLLVALSVLPVYPKLTPSPVVAATSNNVRKSLLYVDPSDRGIADLSFVKIRYSLKKEWFPHLLL